MTVIRSVGRWMAALLPLAILPACWESEPTKPPEPDPDPVLAYAMFPANLTPDALAVEQGDVVGVLGQPVPPRTQLAHQVNFANHFLLECVVNENEYEGTYWPPCSLAVAEGFVVIERDYGAQLASFSCNARYNYVPGQGINPTISHCADLVMTGYEVAQGPGVAWRGAWTVTGCDPTWIAFRHGPSVEIAPGDSPALPALSDTTRITVAEPCNDG